MNTFHCRINGGDEQTIETTTGIYSLACIAALAVLTDKQIGDVEIWVPRLVEAGYGPYHYRVQPSASGSGFESVQLVGSLGMEPPSAGG